MTPKYYLLGFKVDITVFNNFPLYQNFLRIIEKVGAGRNVDKRSIGQIFMFYNCTMARDIPKMGKILKLYILEMLGHPNGVYITFLDMVPTS